MGHFFQVFHWKKGPKFKTGLHPTLLCLELDSKSNTIRISSSQYIMARTFSVVKNIAPPMSHDRTTFLCCIIALQRRTYIALQISTRKIMRVTRFFSKGGKIFLFLCTVFYEEDLCYFCVSSFTHFQIKSGFPFLRHNHFTVRWQYIG